MAADRIAAPKVKLGELLVDDPDFMRAIHIARQELAAGDQRQPQRGEVPGRYCVVVRVHVLAGLRFVALHRDAVLPIVIGQHAHHGERSRLHPRRAAQFIQQPAIEKQSPVSRIAVQPGIYGKRQQTVSLEAGIESFEISQ